MRVEGNPATSSRTMHSAVKRIEECDLTWEIFGKKGKTPVWVASTGRGAGYADVAHRQITMLDVLLSAMVCGTIGKGAIGEKGLVTITAPVLPGCLSGVHVASTVVPTVLLWTNAVMSSLLAVPRPLGAPDVIPPLLPALFHNQGSHR